MVAFDLRLHALRERMGKLAFGAFEVEGTVLHRDFHAGRDLNLLFSNSRHSSSRTAEGGQIHHQTEQRSSPPTLLFLASRPVITPFGVDKITIPRAV